MTRPSENLLVAESSVIKMGKTGPSPGFLEESREDKDFFFSTEDGGYEERREVSTLPASPKTLVGGRGRGGRERT